MANEIRLRPNFVAGGLSADMAAAATSMSSGGLADLPAVDTTNHAALTLWRTDLAGRVTQKEVIWVTAHTAAAVTATVVRGREGTTAQNWLTGDRWSCSQISSDVPVICTSTTRPANPYMGQVIYETDTGLSFWYDSTKWVFDREPTSYILFGNAAVGSTNTTTYLDVPSSPSKTITKRLADTSIIVVGHMSCYRGGGSGYVDLSLLMNGVDHWMSHFFFNNPGVHMEIPIIGSIGGGMPVGNYPVKLRWKIDNGAGMSMNMDGNDFYHVIFKEGYII